MGISTRSMNTTEAGPLTPFVAALPSLGSAAAASAAAAGAASAGSADWYTVLANWQNMFSRTAPTGPSAEPSATPTQQPDIFAPRPAGGNPPSTEPSVTPTQQPIARRYSSVNPPRNAPAQGPSDQTATPTQQPSTNVPTNPPSTQQPSAPRYSSVNQPRNAPAQGPSDPTATPTQQPSTNVPTDPPPTQGPTQAPQTAPDATQNPGQTNAPTVDIATVDQQFNQLLEESIDWFGALNEVKDTAKNQILELKNNIESIERENIPFDKTPDARQKLGVLNNAKESAELKKGAYYTAKREYDNTPDRSFFRRDRLNNMNDAYNDYLQAENSVTVAQNEFDSVKASVIADFKDTVQNLEVRMQHADLIFGQLATFIQETRADPNWLLRRQNELSQLKSNLQNWLSAHQNELYVAGGLGSLGLLWKYGFTASSFVVEPHSDSLTIKILDEKLIGKELSYYHVTPIGSLLSSVVKVSIDSDTITLDQSDGIMPNEEYVIKIEEEEQTVLVKEPTQTNSPRPSSTTHFSDISFPDSTPTLPDLARTSTTEPSRAEESSVSTAQQRVQGSVVRDPTLSDSAPEPSRAAQQDSVLRDSRANDSVSAGSRRIAQITSPDVPPIEDVQKLVKQLGERLNDMKMLRTEQTTSFTDLGNLRAELASVRRRTKRLREKKRLERELEQARAEMEAEDS